MNVVTTAVVQVSGIGDHKGILVAVGSGGRTGGEDEQSEEPKQPLFPDL
jgi:hypothetical protein